MKNTNLILSVLIVLTSGSAFAAKNCARHVAGYMEGKGVILQMNLEKTDSNGLQTYTIRTNLQGGEAAHEVIVKRDCSFASYRLLWAE